MEYRTAEQEGLISVSCAARRIGIAKHRLEWAIDTGKVDAPRKVRRQRRYYSETDFASMREDLIRLEILKV